MDIQKTITIPPFFDRDVGIGLGCIGIGLGRIGLS